MWNRIAIQGFGIVTCFSIQYAFAQETASPPKDDHEYEQLGIEVIDSPGVGVQVSLVAVDGPADSSGIYPGDYLLSIQWKTDRPT